MQPHLVRGTLVGLLLLASTTPNSALQQPKGSSITGRVTRLDTGAPVENGMVMLQGMPGVLMRHETGEGGTFSFTEVPDGEYRLTAAAKGLVSLDATLTQPNGIGMLIRVKDGQRIERVELSLARKSAIEGHVLDSTGIAMRGVPMSLAVVRRVNGQVVIGAIATESVSTDAEGKFRFPDLLPGDYYVLATAGPFSRINPNQKVEVPAHLLSYRPTFFPGVDRPAAARPVRVGLGNDALDVTFALLPALTLVRVLGAVFDVGGQPMPDANVVLIPTEGDIPYADLAVKTTSDASGKFSYPGVPPGAYILQAYAKVPGTDAFGSRPIVVPATDDGLSGIDVTVQPPVAARGRVTFEGRQAPSKDGFFATFAGTDLYGPVVGVVLSVPIHDDWTFEIKPLISFGLIRVNAPAGWALKSVSYHGRDITDEPSDFKSADVDGLEVTMTSHLASIVGTVNDGVKPTASAYVLLIPEGVTNAAQRSRLLKNAQTKSDGSFRIAGVLAGKYRIVALPAPMSVDSQEKPMNLQSVATPLILAEDESKTVVLKLFKG